MCGSRRSARVILACQQAGIQKVGLHHRAADALTIGSLPTVRLFEKVTRHGNECRIRHGDGEVMVEMNTTPLIDVMLVLLVLLIITLPIQTHAVKLDMPRPTSRRRPSTPEIGGSGRGFRRHHHLERRRGGPRHLDSYFADAASKNPQPEIHVNPNRLAKYDAVAKVLADAQRLGVTHIGFTGIDQYN